MLNNSLIIWNLLVFIVYGYDKWCAKHKKHRVPEKHLLLMTCCMAGIGALLGMFIWQHKTSKWYFYIAWLIGLYTSYLVYTI